MPSRGRGDFVPTPAFPAQADRLERPPGIINTLPSPTFGVVAKLFQNIRETKGSKSKVVESFIEIWKRVVGPDIFPCIRLLLPERDRDRSVYGIKEQAIARVYIEVLGLDKHSEAAQRLLKWKQPKNNNDNSGDFASVCFEAINSRKSVREVDDLTVDELNDLLDKLSRERKHPGYVAIFHKIMHHCTAEQQTWIIRIILKDLKIGIREKGVFAVLHPDAQELFGVCSDLRRVCWTLTDKSVRLEKGDTEIKLFQAFLPQLCRRTKAHDLNAIARLMTANPFIIEEKLDGERMQLHMRGGPNGEFFWCSRKGKDYTYLYGGSAAIEGSLTSHVASAFKVDSCILDGEMLVWDPSLEKYLAFGTLKTAALDHSNEAGAPRPCFKVFDVLMINGRVIADAPLHMRKRALFDSSKDADNQYRVFTPVHGRLDFAEQWEGRTGEDIGAFLEEVVRTKGEGLVVKDPNGAYVTDGRENQWCKVKPEYADEMGETIDCLVIGGWWGTGKRGGKISSLLCGLRNEHDWDPDIDRPTFKTFVKIGGGMSVTDYNWIEDNHKKHWKDFDRRRPPSWMTVGASGLDDKPDVYIEPKDSFVISIKASEFIPAKENFGFSHCLRFPRCKYIFWDATSRRETDNPEGDGEIHDMWHCASVDDANEIMEGNKSKDKKRKFGDYQSERRKKFRRVGGGRIAAKMGTAFAGQAIKDEKVNSDIFDGLMFYVLPGTRKTLPKKELEKIVVENGGDFTQQLGVNANGVAVADNISNVWAKTQISRGKDIVMPEFILECVKRKILLPCIKEFALHACEETEAQETFDMTLQEVLEYIESNGENTGVKAEDTAGDETEEEEAEEEEEMQRPSRSSIQTKKLNLPGSFQGVVEGGTPSATEPEDDSGSGDDSRGHNGADDDDDDEFWKGKSNANDDGDMTEEEEGEGEGDDSKPDITKSATKPATWSGSQSRTQTLGSPPADSDEEAAPSPTQMKMGDDDDAMDFDPDNIFKHVTFYIDTDKNADANELTRSEFVNSKTENAVKSELDQAASDIRSNGGKITTDLSDPKLGHIIMSEKDTVRRAEFVKKYNKPYFKHLVTPEWVSDSLEESTMMVESAYAP